MNDVEYGPFSPRRSSGFLQVFRSSSMIFLSMVIQFLRLGFVSKFYKTIYTIYPTHLLKHKTKFTKTSIHQPKSFPNHSKSNPNLFKFDHHVPRSKTHPSSSLPNQQCLKLIKNPSKRIPTSFYTLLLVLKPGASCSNLNSTWTKLNRIRFKQEALCKNQTT